MGRNFQSKIHHQGHPLGEIKPIDASAKDVDELQADLSDFIVEIRKENGEQYPSSSMYDLISGLSLYPERNMASLISKYQVHLGLSGIH